MWAGSEPRARGSQSLHRLWARCRSCLRASPPFPQSTGLMRGFGVHTQPGPRARSLLCSEGRCQFLAPWCPSRASAALIHRWLCSARRSAPSASKDAACGPLRGCHGNGGMQNHGLKPKTNKSSTPQSPKHPSRLASPSPFCFPLLGPDEELVLPGNDCGVLGSSVCPSPEAMSRADTAVSIFIEIATFFFLCLQL